MKPPPPAAQQIAALLTGRCYLLASEWAEKDLLDGTEYRNVFTVTAREVLHYVNTNGIPSGSWSDRPGPDDGIYFLEEEQNFRVYYQERGFTSEVLCFATKEEAIHELVNQLLE